MSQFIGIQEGLLLARNPMFSIGTQPFKVHPIEVNKQVSSGWVLLVANFFPGQFEEIVASFLDAFDSEVGIYALRDRAMTPASARALFLYGHPATVEYLLVGFVVQENGRKLKLLLKSPQVSKHNSHRVVIFVVQVIVTERVNHDNIGPLFANQLAEIFKRLHIISKGMEKQRVKHATNQLERIAKRHIYFTGSDKLLKTLVAALRPYFVIKVEDFTGAVYGKVRLAFLSMLATVSTKQRLLQREAQADVERKNALTGFGLAGNEPCSAFREKSFAYDAWHGEWGVCCKFIGGEDGQKVFSNQGSPLAELWGGPIQTAPNPCGGKTRDSKSRPCMIL